MKPTRPHAATLSAAIVLTFGSLVAGYAAESTDELELAWDLWLTLETVRNVSGGIRQERSDLGTLDLAFDLGFGQGRRHRLVFYGVGSFHDGPLPSTSVGDLQGTSNIEAPGTAKLLEAWYERSWGDGGRHGLLFGLHDFSSEFDFLKSAQLFRHSSFGLTAELGLLPASTYPDTSIALRFRTAPSDRSYLIAAVYDGVPGDPDEPYGTQVKLASSDGLFQAIEVGRRWADGDGMIGIGVWNRTTDFTGADGARYDRNRGAYLIAEHPVASIGGTPLTGFVQAGTARRGRNDIDGYLGAGVNLDDAWGFAIGSAQFSDGRNAETAIELTYLRELRSWVAIQPDLQWIRNPGGGDAVDDAFQLGITLFIRLRPSG